VKVALDALEFARLVRANDVVAWLPGTAEPTALVSRLGAQAEACPPFSILVGLGLGDAFPVGRANVRVRAFGGAGTTRRFLAESAGGVLPCNVSNLCDLVAHGDLRIDVVLLQVAGPDAQGRYNTGPAIQFLREAMEHARVVVAQVNAHVPWTEGDTLIDGSRLHVLVEADTPLPQVPSSAPDAVATRIGDHIATLVPDRAVLQLGIGAIPDATTRALARRRGLGLHSGVIGDGVLGLVEAGAVDNRHKEIDEGVSVTMALHGTDRLNAFASRNGRVQVRSPRYTHAPEVLARLSRLMAINSAVEVDLTGQINAEVARGRHIGLIGGQGDFMRAAMRCAGGRSIIALPATAAGGTQSRIVAGLTGGVVTTPRADADVVVTEYGIAELRGRTLEERARALAGIAAPSLRKELLAAAEKLV
jgi:acetyl-CoA hydrolase